MITRRSVLLAGGIGMLVAHRLSSGQPAMTIRRVGILALRAETGLPLHAAFKQGMHDLGWLEGKNVEYLLGDANGNLDRLDALAKELIVRKVEVILAGSSLVTRAAERATKTIPIVMITVNAPVSSGFVTSLAKPGGNITGIASQSDVVLGKTIEILHEVTPGARRIAILLNESNAAYSVGWAAAQRACAVLGLIALRVVASAPAQLGAAVEQIVQQRSEAAVVFADTMFFSERVKLQELMQATGLPVAYGWREHVVAGGLLSYATDLAVAWRNAAQYVDKILKGANPGDLPIEQPAKVELVINLKTAKALGLTIPQSVLLRADEVIQ